jgi:uncharacterized protein (TIGR03382 family)
MVLLTLLCSAPLAGSLDTSFDDPGDAWPGAEVRDGVMAVEHGSAVLELEHLLSLEGSLRLRLAQGEGVSLVLGEAWVADYTASGGISLGGEPAAFPPSHRQWRVDSQPTLQPDGQHWDGANTLHCDVAEAASGERFLYWTGELTPGYGYRQIGLARSWDLEAWQEHEDNPVLSVDFDLTSVDGVHVHMPAVVVTDTGWHMLYSCYQNDVGNRICRATSTDGVAWTPQGVALDLGEEGAFDSASLRQPELWIGDDGTWHLLYNGTDPDGHYGPTAWATSPDGVSWTKQGVIAEDEDFLQGGGVLRTPYGLEQWFNCADAFCHAWADPADPATWTPSAAGLAKTTLPDSYGAGYIQAPSLLAVGPTQHMWFNAYGSDAEGSFHERIFHATSEPVPGGWLDIELAWDGATLGMAWTDDQGMKASLEAPAEEVEGLFIEVQGSAEVDDVHLSWTQRDDGMVDTGDTDTEVDSDLPDDTAVPGDTDACRNPDPDPGCGCGGGGSLAGWFLLVLAGLRRREGQISGDQQRP